MSHGWFLQLFVHDMGVDQALLWVLETIGCGSNDGEAMLPPQGDRGLVGAHYDVELYRQKSQASSFLDGMFAKNVTYPLSLLLRMHHVRRVGNVASCANEVGLQYVGPCELLVVFQYIGFHVGGEPVLLQVLLRGLWVKDIGVASGNHLMKNLPNRLSIFWCCKSNLEGGFLARSIHLSACAPWFLMPRVKVPSHIFLRFF